MQVSMLKMVSFGTVTANKPLSSMNIEVTPSEKLTMLNGELTDNLVTENVKGADADGAAFESTIKTAASITARWLPFGSNRKTAPDVRRGEKVCIWQYGDADKYYWSELEYNGKLRKLETVVFMISNTKVEEEEPTNENTYFFLWSTHDKMIQLHTGTSDDEPFGYDFLLNTKDGNFQITDTIENTMFMDSAAKRIVLKNAAGTSYDLNDEDLYINVVKDMITVVGGDMTTVVTGKYSIKADGDYLVQAPKVDYVTPTMTTSELFNSGSDALIGGKMTVTQGLLLGKGMTTGVSGSGGGISIKGPMDLDGSLTSSSGAKFSGSVVAPNIK